jgi:hypothetical protein
VDCKAVPQSVFDAICGQLKKIFPEQQIATESNIKHMLDVKYNVADPEIADDEEDTDDIMPNENDQAMTLYNGLGKKRKAKAIAFLTELAAGVSSAEESGDSGSDGNEKDEAEEDQPIEKKDGTVHEELEVGGIETRQTVKRKRNNQ